MSPGPNSAGRRPLASPLIALALTLAAGVLLFTLLGGTRCKALSLFFIEPLKSAYALSELSIKARRCC